jgi:hypothetical protein
MGPNLLSSGLLRAALAVFPIVRRLRPRTVRPLVLIGVAAAAGIPGLRALAGPGQRLDDENDGAAGAGSPRAGCGLAGMRERAELLGGTLEVGGGDGWWRVRRWVPVLAATG